MSPTLLKALAGLLVLVCNSAVLLHAIHALATKTFVSTAYGIRSAVAREKAPPPMAVVNVELGISVEDTVRLGGHGRYRSRLKTDTVKVSSRGLKEVAVMLRCRPESLVIAFEIQMKDASDDPSAA